MLTALYAPIINKYVPNKAHQTKIFSQVKLVEGISISICTYLYGYIRQKTGSYTEMSLFLILISFGGYSLACYLEYLKATMEIIEGDGKTNSAKEFAHR